MDALDRLKLAVEPYLIRVRYSTGWMLAVLAVGLVLVGAWGMLSPYLVAPIDTVIGGDVGQRLAIIATNWPLSTPVFAAVTWFTLKL